MLNRDKVHWTRQRKELLTRLWYYGLSLDDLAERLGTGPRAIRVEAHKLMLPDRHRVNKVKAG